MEGTGGVRPLHAVILLAIRFLLESPLPGDPEHIILDRDFDVGLHDLGQFGLDEVLLIVFDDVHQGAHSATVSASSSQLGARTGARPNKYAKVARRLCRSSSSLTLNGASSLVVG